MQYVYVFTLQPSYWCYKPTWLAIGHHFVIFECIKGLLTLNNP